MIMTREEEIITACKGFLAAYPNIDQAGLSIGFLDGAKWADKHPVNVWHDANEKPRTKEWILVQFDEDDYDTHYLNDLYIDMWCTWCKTYNVSRWAYISDLLPKGGEK